MNIRTSLVAAALCWASSASAITYHGVLSAGGITATYAIVTDGTLGIVATANLLSTSASITNGVVTKAFVGGNNNFIFGNGVTATATQLFFDPTVYGVATFTNVDAGVYTGLCMSGIGVSCGYPLGAQTVVISVDYPTSSASFGITGPFLVGEVAMAPPPTAIPEPASWALLIAGFGLTGAALRQRRAVQAA